MRTSARVLANWITAPLIGFIAFLLLAWVLDGLGIATNDPSDAGSEIFWGGLGIWTGLGVAGVKTRTHSRSQTSTWLLVAYVALTAPVIAVLLLWAVLPPGLN